MAIGGGSKESALTSPAVSDIVPGVGGERSGGRRKAGERNRKWEEKEKGCPRQC